MHSAELDFRLEAANLVQVSTNMRRARVVARVPAVVGALTSRRVLVMRFCEGDSLKDGRALRGAGVDCELLVSRCCEAWAVQLFTDGHFQCDPHAANLLVDAQSAEHGPVCPHHTTRHATRHAMHRATSHATSHATRHATCHATRHATCHATRHVTCHITRHATCHATRHVTCHITRHATCHVTRHATCHVTRHVTCHITRHVTCHVTRHASYQVPVLLDFGLCKRLSSSERLAFCGLVHALSELDPDRLLASLTSLGFVFNQTPEPFDALRALLFVFRNTEADAATSRRKVRAKSREMRGRRVARREAAKEEGRTLEPPAVPGVVVFFMRTVQMLQGLCTLLEVQLPFLRPFAIRAQQALLAHSRETAALAPPLPPPRAPPTSALQERSCMPSISLY